jgi:uncharacterized protein
MAAATVRANRAVGRHGHLAPASWSCCEGYSIDLAVGWSSGRELIMSTSSGGGAAGSRLTGSHAQAHWSFMDGYAEAMIARGPTLTPDRTTWTGSMHMADLPDAQPARVFAFQEPFYRAGAYGEVLVRRWRNALGRTMWDYPAEPGAARRFLVIGRGKPGVEATRQALEAAQRRWFGEPGHRDGFILRGPLLADDGAGWVGSALLVQRGDRAAVEAMLAGALGAGRAVRQRGGPRLAVRRAPPRLTRPAHGLQVTLGQPRGAVRRGGGQQSLGVRPRTRACTWRMRPWMVRVGWWPGGS